MHLLLHVHSLHVWELLKLWEREGVTYFHFEPFYERILCSYNWAIPLIQQVNNVLIIQVLSGNVLVYIGLRISPLMCWGHSRKGLCSKTAVGGWMCGCMKFSISNTVQIKEKPKFQDLGKLVLYRHHKRASVTLPILQKKDHTIVAVGVPFSKKRPTCISSPQTKPILCLTYTNTNHAPQGATVLQI